VTPDGEERFGAGVVRSVRATHVMPDDDGPEGEPHAHDYRVEVAVEVPALDLRGMAVDLLDLEAALEGALDGVRDSDLDGIRPPHLPAVTVEVFARWIHDQVRERIPNGDIAVRVWEHEQAFGSYRSVG
jgi:6-pyruvoyl-tetrahydropterin synthase